MSRLSSRLSWLNWWFRFCRPQWRWPALKGALFMELIGLYFRLKGEPITHWLEPDPKPPGICIVTKSVPSLRFRVFGKEYCCWEEIPVEYAPYSLEVADEVRRRTGRPAQVVEITCVLTCESV